MLPVRELIMWLLLQWLLLLLLLGWGHVPQDQHGVGRARAVPGEKQEALGAGAISPQPLAQPAWGQCETEPLCCLQTIGTQCWEQAGPPHTSQTSSDFTPAG